MLPMTKLWPTVKHVVWSESVMIKRYKVPTKILNILKTFIVKTNNLNTCWRRVEVFKTKYWFWEWDVYMINFYKTWYSKNYIYWAWQYIASIYFDRLWNCISLEWWITPSEYIRPFKK